MMQEEASNILPDTGTIIKEAIEKSGYDVNKPPSDAIHGVSFVRGMIKGGIELVQEYTDRIIPEIERKKLIQRDIKIFDEIAVINGQNRIYKS